MSDNPFVGTWTYRSLLNDPDMHKPFNDLEFGMGTLVITEAAPQLLQGTIGGPDGGRSRCTVPEPTAHRCRCAFKARAWCQVRHGFTTTSGG